ncbi:hypothetical protein ABVL1U2_490056 [Acinetobacter baumannii]|nr:hypothetical protein ABVL1U2_490056 [Acinetobacter baumannii]
MFDVVGQTQGLKIQSKPFYI